MARIPRSELFDPDEIAVLHVTQRCVRRCFLLGNDPVSGKNHDHRKQWLENQLQHFAAFFGIDLIAFSILSNHFHLVLRSRPDVVACWEDSKVARHWLMICPPEKDEQGQPKEPTESDLNTIRNDPPQLSEIRRRLSDISWWMRLLCQPLAARANREEDQQGRFWQGRFGAVRLCDEASVLACAAYVDLNVIRAALAETLEGSDYTSIQRRIESLSEQDERPAESSPDRFLAPVEIDERQGTPGPMLSTSPFRSSDKGFFPISTLQYICLLDWTARHVVPGKPGATPSETPEVLGRLGVNASQWTELVCGFGRLFSRVAGLPDTLSVQRTRTTCRPFRVRQAFHELFAPQVA